MSLHPVMPAEWLELLDQDEQPAHFTGEHGRMTLLSANVLLDAKGKEWRNPKPLLVRQAERLVLHDEHELYLAYAPREVLLVRPGLVLARVVPIHATQVWAIVRGLGRDPGGSAEPGAFQCWLWRGGRRNELSGPVVCDWSSSWCP